MKICNFIHVYLYPSSCCCFHLFSLKQSPVQEKRKSSSGFAGFKKGFLFGSSAKPKHAKPASEKADDLETYKKETKMPFVKAQAPKEDKSKYAMPEVQEAMQQGQHFLQNKG